MSEIVSNSSSEQQQQQREDVVRNVNVNWCDERTNDYVSLTWDVIDANAIINRARSDRAGAVSTFLGTTRDNFEGKSVLSLEYEAYAEMALDYMRKIIDKIRTRWSVITVAIEHKLGSCPVGDVSVVIAVSSEHRKESLGAIAFAIDDLKANVPIWKKECYGAGDASWKANKEFVVDSDHNDPISTSAVDDERLS